jgi:hypothetical protein
MPPACSRIAVSLTAYTTLIRHKLRIVAAVSSGGPARATETHGRIASIPVTSQKSTSVGYSSSPYPKHAYSLVQD